MFHSPQSCSSLNYRHMTHFTSRKITISYKHMCCSPCKTFHYTQCTHSHQNKIHRHRYRISTILITLKSNYWSNHTYNQQRPSPTTMLLSNIVYFYLFDGDSYSDRMFPIEQGSRLLSRCRDRYFLNLDLNCHELRLPAILYLHSN